MDNGQCYDSFTDEAGLQTRMFEVIYANTTATFEEIKETHDTLINATKNETSKDKLYEMYHEYFTKTKTITVQPTAKDYQQPYRVKNLDLQTFVNYQPVDAAGNQLLSPDFKNTMNVPLYTTPQSAQVYMMYYNALKGMLQSQI